MSYGSIQSESVFTITVSREEVVGISTSGEYTRVPVVKTMPVYITYFTMGRDIEGNLTHFADIYDRDAPVLAALEAPRVGNRARESSEEVIAIEQPGA